MEDVLFAIFAIGAFMGVSAAYWCYLRKIWRAIGSLTFLVAFLLTLNIATIGAVLLVFHYQDQESISSHWTAVCVIGPALAYFFFSLSAISQSILVALLFLKRFLGSSLSSKQVIVIMASLVLVSCLLVLTPAVWVAMNNTAIPGVPPVITAIQCADDLNLNQAADTTDISVNMFYIRSLILICNIVPNIMTMLFVLLRIVPANLFSRRNNILVAVFVVLALFIVPAVVGGLHNVWLLDVFGLKRDVSNHIFVSPEMSFYTLLLPVYLVFAIASETWQKENNQNESKLENCDRHLFEFEL